MTKPTKRRDKNSKHEDEYVAETTSRTSALDSSDTVLTETHSVKRRRSLSHKQPHSHEGDKKEDTKKEDTKNEKVKKKMFESRRVIFIMGTVIGLMVAGFFGATSNPSMKAELDRLVSFDSVSGLLDDWKEALPSGLQSILSDIDSSGNEDPLYGSAESFSVGRRMASNHNLTSKHSVVMVPGVISTGIESWS